MSRSVQKSPTEKKKKDVTSSILFQRSLELMFNLCTLGGSQRAICPGIRPAACATRRTYSYTSEKELGKELDVNVDEEQRVFVVVLLLSAMNWTSSGK